MDKRCETGPPTTGARCTTIILSFCLPQSSPSQASLKQVLTGNIIEVNINDQLEFSYVVDFFTHRNIMSVPFTL